MLEERVVGGVSKGKNLTEEGLGEGVGMVSSMADIRPKVVN